MRCQKLGPNLHGLCTTYTKLLSNKFHWLWWASLFTLLNPFWNEGDYQTFAKSAKMFFLTAIIGLKAEFSHHGSFHRLVLMPSDLSHLELFRNTKMVSVGYFVPTLWWSFRTGTTLFVAFLVFLVLNGKQKATKSTVILQARKQCTRIACGTIGRSPLPMSIADEIRK